MGGRTLLPTNTKNIRGHCPESETRTRRPCFPTWGCIQNGMTCTSSLFIHKSEFRDWKLLLLSSSTKVNFEIGSYLWLDIKYDSVQWNSGSLRYSIENRIIFVGVLDRLNRSQSYPYRTLFNTIAFITLPIPLLFRAEKKADTTSQNTLGARYEVDSHCHKV